MPKGAKLVLFLVSVASFRVESAPRAETGGTGGIGAGHNNKSSSTTRCVVDTN